MKFIKWNFFAGKEIENEKDKQTIMHELNKEYAKLERELKLETQQQRLNAYRIRYL